VAKPLKPGPVAPAPGPVSAPPIPAWVTAPGPSVLCAPGIAGRFIADFDRKDGLTQSENEALVRVLRPGVIVLPNFELDTPPSPRPANVMTVLDSVDDKTNGAADEAGLTVLKLRAAVPCAVVVKELTLRCDAADAKRIRVFQHGLPAGTASKLGPVAGAELKLPGGKPPAIDYWIEALTLPGDPTLPHPTAAPPTPPEGINATLPSGVKDTDPIYRTRAPADVWLELDQLVDAPFRPVRDVALVTIAPWLLLPNTRPVERLYFTYVEPEYPAAVPGRPPPPPTQSNHEFAYDLCEACKIVFGASRVDVDPNESKHFAASDPSSTKAVYLADGKKFFETRGGHRLADPWMQDELEIGYCYAPHAWLHVALHNPRGGGLRGFVRSELAGPGFGVFDALPQPASDAADFGGNLEVSLPVDKATPALPKTGGGPSVPAHPRAPFGKIIVGDCADRPVQPQYHDFLVAQKVQPVLPLDTSWLNVGHVDEFLSFIPSRSAKGFKLVLASTVAMNVLLEEIKRIPFSGGRTNFHSGLVEEGKYAEESAEHLHRHELRDFNRRLNASKLDPIRKRLKTGLGLTDADIIPLPTYFKLPKDQTLALTEDDARTIAHTVGSVNMQVVNGHLLVPRPFGARMSAKDAKNVVERTMNRIGWNKPVLSSSPGGFYFWVRPGDELQRVAAAFADRSNDTTRVRLISFLETGAALTGDALVAADGKSTQIKADAKNTTGPNPLAAAIDSSGYFKKYKRLWIPHHTVDVLEVYMRSVFEAEGNTVHFIDDWYQYHCAMGEVHCGTNVIRTPPELDPKFTDRWWDSYQPDLDLGYDPSA
jgi:hypothetical protein